MTPKPDPVLRAVRERIAAAARSAGRPVTDITLIAVSKMRNAVEIAPLLDAGQIDFGESRVAEAIDKWPASVRRDAHVRLHLIGQLQSNKAVQAVALFDSIHSVDRVSLIDALGVAQRASGRRPEIFIQVNIGNEAQKGGCAIADVAQLIGLARCANLEVAGLMAIPPADSEPAPYFALLAKLARDHRLAGLSMGMSSDFEIAIKLGATHIRVGSALFGEHA